MIASKNTKGITLLRWSGHHVVWLTVLAAAVAFAYHFNLFTVSIPWLAVSVIGTAVAFYVGFKNNSAYDRMWEARKIWGGIVNSSRSWGMQVDGFLTSQFSDKEIASPEINKVKQRLVYRHIAYLYALRDQLLIPTSWEHVSQTGKVSELAKKYRKYGVGMFTDETENSKFTKFLPSEEIERLSNYKNTATQIINEQSRDLTEARENNMIDDFRHMQMSKTLSDFYEHQGKCERIKKFPLPRLYANLSRIFVGIFIFLLQFSVLPEILKIGDWGLPLAILVTALIGWVYLMMELAGDYTENPFQGMANDIPMLSLCRVIEIDLREMLGETDLPDPIEAIDDILM